MSADLLSTDLQEPSSRKRQVPFSKDTISVPDFISDWLDDMDTLLTPLNRTSTGNVLRFLGVRTIDDLFAIDEPALTFAAANRPESHASLGFSILDVSKLRVLLRRFGNRNLTVYLASDPGPDEH